MIRAIRKFQWAEAWIATKLLLIAIGAVAVSVWLAQPFPWYIVAASVFAVAVAWFLCFHIVCSWRERQERKQARETHRQINERLERLNRRSGPGSDHTMLRSAIAEPPMRKRFVRFDPETGDEIFKFE